MTSFSYSWEPSYAPDKHKLPLMPDYTALHKRFLSGDKEAERQLQNPQFQQNWRQMLQKAGRMSAPGYDKKGHNDENLPWKANYKASSQDFEDVLGMTKAEKLVPGSGLEVSFSGPYCLRKRVADLLHSPSNDLRTGLISISYTLVNREKIRTVKGSLDSVLRRRWIRLPRCLLLY